MQDWLSINKKLFVDYLGEFDLSINSSKIITISTYKPHYTRTETIHNLFDELGVNWKAINYYPKLFPIRYFLGLGKLILHIRKNDLVYLHFRGYELFIPVVLICKIFGKKLFVDHFVSIRDTLCRDRKKFKPDSIIGKLLLGYDRLIFKRADKVLVDTKTHADFFINELGCQKEKCGYLYVGCNTNLFYPRKVDKNTDLYTVFWYGSVLPLQGLEIILKAAKLCESEPRINFLLVGPIKKKHSDLINELQLKNTEFRDRIPYEELPLEICKADLCLGGHFSGDIMKASRVVAGKTYQFLACNKPTVLGNNLANKELISDGIWVEMGDYNALHNLIVKNSYK